MSQDGQMSRDEKILSRISDGMRILEVGPSIAPILPKAGRQNVFTLDHASKEDLEEKYSGIGVDVSRVEDVDFIWKSGPIDDCVPKHMHGSFDAIIASHVFEHIPDPVTFLQSLGVLLQDGGYVSLANPDKRFTFDYLRQLTVTADIIEAYEDRRSRHTRKSLFSQKYEAVENDGQQVWATWIPLGQLAFMQSSMEAELSEITNNGDYIDCHAWVFTPSSFDLLILELGALGLIPFRVEIGFSSWGCEFYRTLVKTSNPIQERNLLSENRLQLHALIQDELRAPY